MARDEEFEAVEAARELSGGRRVTDLLLVAIGGCLGAVTRYLLDAYVVRHAGSSLPWATLAINVTGAFALGVLTALTVERALLPELLRPALGIGFLGAYTTFSTFAVDAVVLAEGGMLVRAATYVVAMNVVGIAAAVAGFAVGRTIP